MADWYGTLSDTIKSNLNELRYCKSNIEYSLTDIKQGSTETTDDYINRIIRETRNSGVPENILVGMLAGGLRPDLAGIVLPQTPRTMQQLRSVAAVAEKTLTVTNSKPLAQLSAHVAELSKMEDRMMDALSNKLGSAIQTLTSRRPTRQPTNSLFNSPQQRRLPCNYCGGYCLSKLSCPARFAICGFCKIKGHFENVCRKQATCTHTQNRPFQRYGFGPVPGFLKDGHNGAKINLTAILHKNFS